MGVSLAAGSCSSTVGCLLWLRWNPWCTSPTTLDGCCLGYCWFFCRHSGSLRVLNQLLDIYFCWSSWSNMTIDRLIRVSFFFLFLFFFFPPRKQKGLLHGLRDLPRSKRIQGRASAVCRISDQRGSRPLLEADLIWSGASATRNVTYRTRCDGPTRRCHVRYGRPRADRIFSFFSFFSFFLLSFCPFFCSLLLSVCRSVGLSFSFFFLFFCACACAVL